MHDHPRQGAQSPIMGAAMGKCVLVTGGVVSLLEQEQDSVLIGHAWGQP